MREWAWYSRGGNIARLWYSGGDDGVVGDKLAITPAGNVGIKTTNPQANLDVNGTIRIDSLKGSANAYACINSNGILYRSSAPCVSSS